MSNPNQCCTSSASFRRQITGILRTGLIAWASTEFNAGLRHAETHCWNCDAEHAPDAHMHVETLHCKKCGVDLIPF